MVRRGQPLRLDAQVNRLENAVRELAVALLRAVLAEELSNHLASGRLSTRSSTKKAELVPATTRAETPSPAPAQEPKSALNGARRAWTRDRVIEELAEWLLTGQAVEAAFVTRHGRPGLAAAAKRIFGRFDAALNAANLHLARQHPDGLPSNR
jgi:hypothetical protein